jgi:hypothetical protein
MAFYPCDYGPHYNPRRNYLAYVGVGSGNEISRWRLRFCATHIGAVQEHLAEFKVNPEDGTLSGVNSNMAYCLSCREPGVKGGRQVFVTCYPPNQEREDYWAGIHVDCTVPDVIHDRWTSKSA